MSTRKSDVQTRKDGPVTLPFGLCSSKGESLQIKSVKVDVLVINHVAEVTSSLTYQHKEKTSVSSVFSFPEDERTAVCQLNVDIGGRQVLTNIINKPKAQLTKEDAIKDGTAAMIYKGDNSSKGVFSCMLGNIPAQSEATLVLKYVTELQQELDGQLRFTLPTVLNPRYAEGKGDGKPQKGSKTIAPSKVAYNLSMAATVKGDHRISSITCSNAKVDVTFEDGNKKAKVIIGDDFKFDDDLQLHVLYEEPYTPHIVLENGNPKAEELHKKDVSMFSFQPDLRKVSMATGGEYVFIVENSVKMEGSRMIYAKKALQLFLRSLPPDCFFNIISFGAKVNSLFRNSNKYTEKTLKEAFLFLTKMTTDSTSKTSIYKPLDHIFGKKPVSKSPRMVFLLTDGNTRYNSTEKSKITYILTKQSQKTRTRIFTLALGYGFSTNLLKDITHIGGGRVEFIVEEKQLQSKAISLLRYSMQPAITNIEVNWDIPAGLTVEFIPKKSQHVISAGERLVVFAAIQGRDENTTYKPSSVTLKGIQDGKAVSHSVKFTLHKSEDMYVSAPIHRLATKIHIKLLEEEEEETVAKHNPQIPDWMEFITEVDHLRCRIMSLSCYNNTISKYTFYSVMDDKGKVVVENNAQKFCKVPTVTDIYMSEMHVKKAMFFKESLSCSGLFGEMDVEQSFIEEGRKERNREEIEEGFDEDSEEEEEKGSIVEKGIIQNKGISRPASRKKGLDKVSEIAERSPIVDEPKSKAKERGLRPARKRKGFDDVSGEAERSGPAINGRSIVEQMKRPSEKNKGDNKMMLDTPASPSAACVSDNSGGAVLVMDDDQMMTVLSLQQFQGQWTVSTELLQLVGIVKEDMEKSDISKDESIACTAIVLGWLMELYPHRQDEWEMIETKALSWISSHSNATPVDELIQQATLTLNLH